MERNIFEKQRELNDRLNSYRDEYYNRNAPASLAVLRQKAERFSTVIDPAQIAEVALGCQA